MFKALGRNLRGAGLNGFLRRVSRPACALLLALLVPAAACAYTIVLRGGRRIEIPANFTVTPLTLTYETAPGVNVTLLMSSIDVQATERANNEPAGSLLKRAEAGGVSGAAAQRGRRPRRELTQQDVEAARLARQRSEQDYERRRLELGLPSLEESRRRNEEELRRMGEESRRASAAEAESESYWRARASALRGELAAVEAQISYVRARLAELPEHTGLAGYTFISSSPAFFPGFHPVTRFPAVTGHPGFMRGVNGTGAQSAGFIAFGAIAGTQAAPHRGFTRIHFGRHPRVGRHFPPAAVFGLPPAGYDYSYERSGLVSRLHDLEAQRAGLQARWRSLEEEARRAGAPPGWLRP